MPDVAQEYAMEKLLIRNLDPELVEQLKSRAKRNGRSLSAEVKHILESAVPNQAVNMEEILEHMAQMRERTRGSADLIREDRDR